MGWQFTAHLIIAEGMGLHLTCLLLLFSAGNGKKASQLLLDCIPAAVEIKVRLRKAICY